MIRMHTVANMKANAAKNVKIVINAALESGFNPFSQTAAKICSRKTFASSECASDKAQSLRYEAVFEIVFNTNSIVSII